MRWNQVFIDNGSLRPISRFFFSVVMVVFAYLLVGIVLGIASGILAGHLHHLFFWANCLTLVGLLAIFKILTGVFEEKPLGSIGLAFCGRWKTELGIGLVLGAAMILAVAALEWGLGVAHFNRNSIPAKDVLAGGAYYVVLFAVAAASEEITFRGYPFQRLVEAITPAGAIAVTSITFGLVHLGNPSHTLFSTLNTVLMGFPLAVAYLRTRALWLPIGIHFGWNFFQGYALGLEVSGLQFSKTLLKAAVHGPQWLTGGNYGPEAGCLTTSMIAIATVYLLLSRSIYITDEMRALALAAPKPLPEIPCEDLGSPVQPLLDSARMDLPGEN